MSANSNIDGDPLGAQRISFHRRRELTRDDSLSVGGALNFGLPVIVFLAAHIPLGLLLHGSSLLAALHAVATFAVGMYVALSDRRLDRVAYVGAYIIGAEVLWHMADAPILWEFGKYSVVAIFLTAIIRNRLIKVPTLPVLYLVLLLPSIWITTMEVDWTSRLDEYQGARQMISFNISGPLALMVSAWFFSHLKLSAIQLQRLCLALIGPIICISTIALFGVAGMSDLDFGATSNAMASGKFGPNQVSSMLGLGALSAFLFYTLNSKANQGRKTAIVGVIGWLWKYLMVCLMIVFIAQSALTFSRGGLYNTVAAIVVAFLYLVRERGSRLQFIFLALFLFGFSTYVLLPRLNDFTGGAISSRFESTDTTGRESFMEYQLAVFQRHPLFGNGPGRGLWVASHTEYTRLLAEHGLLGLGALLVLFMIVATNLKRAGTIMQKTVVSSLLVWSFVFMGHLGMRLAAPSFMIGVTFATLMLQENQNSNSVRKRQYKTAHKNSQLAGFTSPTAVGNPIREADVLQS